MEDLSYFHAQLWTVHMGIKEAVLRGFNNVCIEIESVESFRILRSQSLKKKFRRAGIRNPRY